jgi:secretion/DNA translocation related TadE-like protein
MTDPRPAGRGARDDTGSASVVAVGLLVAVVGLVVSASFASGALVERSRAAGAADAAALAGADVAGGLTAGVVCDVAGRVAQANRATLLACRADGPVVTVRVSSSLGLVPVTASATAGPPPGEAPRPPTSP